MKYYVLQEDESEPKRYTIHPEDETCGAWEVVCHRVAELLYEWLGEADGETMSVGQIDNGGVLSIDKFNQVSNTYAKFDNDGEGITLPYALHLPAVGIVPAQTIAIWEEEEEVVRNMLHDKPLQDSMIDLTVTLTTGQRPDEGAALGHRIRPLPMPEFLGLEELQVTTILTVNCERELLGLREENAEMRSKIRRLDALHAWLKENVRHGMDDMNQPGWERALFFLETGKDWEEHREEFKAYDFKA